jgi:hypothetical protein
MKPIEKDELYQHLNEFLATKGISLKQGSYAQTIQKSCRILADVINLGQQGIDRAKNGLDQKLDQVRQVIHEKTAPKPPRMPRTETAAADPASAPPAESVKNPEPAIPVRKAASAKRTKRPSHGKKPKPAAKRKPRGSA